MNKLAVLLLSIILGCGSPEPTPVWVRDTGYDWAELEWDGGNEAWLIMVVWTEPGELLTDPDVGLARGIPLEYWPRAVIDSVTWEIRTNEGEFLGLGKARVQRGGDCEPPIRRRPNAVVTRCRAENLPDTPVWLFSAWPAIDREALMVMAR